MKLGLRSNYHEGWAVIRHYANQPQLGKGPSRGPSRGLLRDCTTSPINRFAALVTILARQPIRGQYHLALAEGLEAAGPLCGVCGVDPLPVHRVEAGRVGEGVEVTPSL